MSFADLCEELAATLAVARGNLRNELDGAEPVTGAFLRARVSEGQEARGMFGDVKPCDIGRPIRYGVINDVSGPQGQRAYVAAATRQLVARQLRGLPLPFQSRFHCSLGVAVVMPMGGRLDCQGGRYASWHEREKVWLAWGRSMRVHHCDVTKNHMKMLLGLQFSARYEWRVMLGHPGCPRIALTCSPQEARQLFKARDLPPGKDRRAALRHWVSEHWREAHGVHVRAHLRGATGFDWEGLACTIVPSDADKDALRA